MDREQFDRITLAVIQSGIEVHRGLGPGLSRVYIVNACSSSCVLVGSR